MTRAAIDPTQEEWKEHEEFCNRLKNLMDIKGYTTYSLCKEINRPVASLQYHFYHRRFYKNMSVEFISDLAQALGVSIDFLYYGKEDDDRINVRPKKVRVSNDVSGISEDNVHLKFAEIRKSVNVTQKELGIISNIPQTTIARFEVGKSSISIRKFIKLVKLLGFDLKLVKIFRRNH